MGKGSLKERSQVGVSVDTVDLSKSGNGRGLSFSYSVIYLTQLGNLYLLSTVFNFKRIFQKKKKKLDEAKIKKNISFHTAFKSDRDTFFITQNITASNRSYL